MNEKANGIGKYLIKIIKYVSIPCVYFAGIIAQVIGGCAIYGADNSVVFDGYGVMGYIIRHLGISMLAYIGCVIFCCTLGLTIHSKFKPLSNNEKDDERNFEYSDKGTYGTARMMDKKEEAETVNKYTSANDTSEIILAADERGNVITVPENTFLNRHVAVFGASGKGKSRAFARPYMLQGIKRGESFVITDPKGELYESMSNYFKENGYDVKVFDLIHLENSDSWNCLAEIGGSDLKAQIFAQSIIENTSEGKTGDFWSMCEMSLLKALCLYVDICPTMETTMSNVYTILTTKTPMEMDILFDSLENNERNFAAISAYNIFRGASDNVKGGVIIGLGSKLQVFQSTTVRKMTAHKEIDLVKPAKEKCAYFCITSDQHSAFNFLAVLFYSMLFIDLVEFADAQPKCRCPVPVNFLLDEFPNIGAIPDFTKKISTVRSRGINISVIFQNIAQLQNRYPFGQWEEILGNCDTHVFLGCSDSTTAKFISDKTGIATIALSTQATTTSNISLGHDEAIKVNSSVGKRNIYTPDEILRFPNDELMLFFSGHSPLRAKKFDYSKHPDASKLTSSNVTTHVPEWRRVEETDNTVVNNDGNIPIASEGKPVKFEEKTVLKNNFSNSYGVAAKPSGKKPRL